MMRFEPTSWLDAGSRAKQAADDFYLSAHGVVTAKVLKAKSNSPIDVEAAAGDELCNVPWHQLIKAAYEGLTSTASKMTATGDDYAATEEELRVMATNAGVSVKDLKQDLADAANDRFWK